MKLKKRIVLIYHKVRLFMAEMNKDQVAAFAAQSAFPAAVTVSTGDDAAYICQISAIHRDPGVGDNKGTVPGGDQFQF